MKQFLIVIPILLSGCVVDINRSWDDFAREIKQDSPIMVGNKEIVTPGDFNTKNPNKSQAGFRGFYEFFDPEFNILISHSPKWNKTQTLVFDITSFDYNSSRKIILRQKPPSIILTDGMDRVIKYEAKDIDSLDLKHSSRLEITFRNTASDYINVYFQVPDFYTKTPFMMTVPNPATLDKAQ